MKEKEYWVLHIRKPNRHALKYCIGAVILFIGLIFHINDGTTIPYLYGVTWAFIAVFWYYNVKKTLEDEH